MRFSRIIKVALSSSVVDDADDRARRVDSIEGGRRQREDVDDDDEDDLSLRGFGFGVVLDGGVISERDGGEDRS